MNDDRSTITVASIGSSACGGSWSPVQGDVLTEMLSSNKALSDAEKERLIRETVSIMGECIDPSGQETVNTGLVIGYVQSGKTLSFTSLTALARDNGFRLVILLAGTTNNLVEQSFDRLREDLAIGGTRNWNLFTTQLNSLQQGQAERIETELHRWRRNSPRAKTVLIVSMKQHQHLQNLTSMLATSDFSDVPTLIIDDEGDQAGMNTKAKQEEESTTFARICELRALFPHHSYLLYTATPQAPLLISRIDALSPDFGRVLTPGEHYVGGHEFFIQGESSYVELIPSRDVPDKNDPPSSPPESLRAALRDFFIGVAIGLLEGDFERGRNRSMMIHPAISKNEHLMFARWVRQITVHWVDILRDQTHHDHSRLLDEFRASATGLLATYETSVTFNEIASILADAIEETAISELNTRQQARIAKVDWEGEYSWILIGGIGLDRGFTVEGLTVTYMPRSTGVGNADNIQQRARFFGYKRPYLGLCRIYLTAENIDAFKDYVSHEESVRRSISRHLTSGKSLKDWRRSYFLDQSLKPTRSSVILLEMYQSRGNGGWIVPAHPFEDSATVSDNRELVQQILEQFDFTQYGEEGWNEKQIVPAFSDQLLLADLLPLIGQFRYRSPDDNLQHGSLMLGLERIVSEAPDVRSSFYAFSGPWSGVDYKRTLTEKVPPKIKQLWQGSNARTNYPGARALVSEETVTFQLHRYDIETPDKEQTFRDVPILATHVPDVLMERVWIER